MIIVARYVPLIAHVLSASGFPYASVRDQSPRIDRIVRYRRRAGLRYSEQLLRCYAHRRSPLLPFFRRGLMSRDNGVC